MECSEGPSSSQLCHRDLRGVVPCISFLSRSTPTQTRNHHANTKIRAVWHYVLPSSMPSLGQGCVLHYVVTLGIRVCPAELTQASRLSLLEIDEHASLTLCHVAERCLATPANAAARAQCHLRHRAPRAYVVCVPGKRAVSVLQPQFGTPARQIAKHTERKRRIWPRQTLTNLVHMVRAGCGRN